MPEGIMKGETLISPTTSLPKVWKPKGTLYRNYRTGHRLLNSLKGKIFLMDGLTEREWKTFRSHGWDLHRLK